MRVDADDVSKVIGPVPLLAPVSLTVESAECAVIRGVNGAGKTTLLRILAGLIEPTTGTATIDGEPVDERNAATRAGVAALLGAPTAYRDLTLADHLTLIDASWGRDPDTCDERVDAGLDLFEIGHLQARFPHELSSGQGQLFRLARRLRPGRTWSVIPRRDLLGLRRQPGTGIIATLISALGAVGLTWALIESAVPRIIGIIAGLVMHFGFSAAAEGLRLQGDNAGTPPLLGMSFRAETLGHLAVPLVVSGGSALAASALTAWASGAASPLVAVGWMAMMVGVVAGTTMASAFRGGCYVSPQRRRFHGHVCAAARS